MKQVILASQSPRRKQLLESAHIQLEIIVANTDETYPNNLSVNEIPVYIALEKARKVAQLLEDNKKPIVAADTVVVVDNEILGKPQNRNEAIFFLNKLSSKKHQVITGVAILHNKTEITFYDVTDVEFHLLTQQQIEFYVDEYKPYDKAGAYAIQEWIGLLGIKKINGDYYNVVGLPVSRVLQELDALHKAC